MPILQLPAHLVNQIAAGEVVERPASVVKELIENSLDAGARSITVDLQAGGTKLVRVRDDGAGIPAGELALALSRHATSKIASLEDLEAIASLGFRGEALPSIASVARLALRSRTAGADTGWEVTAGDGAIGEPAPCAHPAGTTVEVRDLFYNTPGRRRFLRAERTEYQHIDKWIRRLALARPDVAFTVSHNGRAVLALQAATSEDERLARLGTVCGEAFASELVYVTREADGMALSGWLALPTFNRSQPDLQFWFVNGRSITDRTLGHAARHAYRDVLFHGRHPAYVLHLAIDPAAVDANAHPAKHEVRFRDGRSVHGMVSQAIEQALAAATANPDGPHLIKERNLEIMVGGVNIAHPSADITIEGGYNACTDDAPAADLACRADAVCSSRHRNSVQRSAAALTPPSITTRDSSSFREAAIDFSRFWIVLPGGIGALSGT